MEPAGETEEGEAEPVVEASSYGITRSSGVKTQRYKFSHLATAIATIVCSKNMTKNID